MKFNIVGKRFWWFLISGLLLIISVVSLSTVGIKTGIEFSSGSLLTVTFEKPVDFGQFKEAIANLGYPDAIVQTTTAGDFVIRTKEITDAEKAAIESGLAAQFGKLTEEEFSGIPPEAATETVKNTMIAVAVALVGILLYITIAFRRMPKPFRYGVCSVIALLHDVLIALGIFSVFGFILNWEINLPFITGILAIIGYSINNTIVVFDRIRENLTLGVSNEFETVVNNSQVETIGRSFNTSITTVFAVLAVLWFVGSTIQNFAIVLLIGVIVGTFDSVCIAPSLLVTWDKGEWSRFIGRKPANA
jgi:preprotein translocase subunit SecF